MKTLQKHLRNTFLAGIFAAIPLAATAFVVWYVEKTTREPLAALFGVNIPFIGIIAAITLIYLLGLIVSSLIGKLCIGLIDRLLSRIPVLRDLYQAWKHISITPGGKEGIFARVVLIPNELGCGQTLGFSSGQPIDGDPKTTCVFVPAAPNPTSGRLYFVPLAQCRFLDTSAEEAFKMILSGGNYIPRAVANSTANAAV